MNRVLLLLTLVACKGQPATKPSVAVTLPKIGLAIDLAGKTAVSDERYGNGYEVRNPALGAGAALHVILLQNPLPPDGAKEGKEADGFTNVQLDRGSDGWTLTSERTDMTMGGKFFVQMDRTVDGKNVECRTTGVLTAAAHQLALTACKSLRVTR